MSEINDGGPAFPTPITSDAAGGIHSAFEMSLEGMTLRDFFAAAALANPALSTMDMSTGVHGTTSLAYRIADSMLAARDRDVP